MAQFKRFSGSESESYNSNYVGREGELTWDPDNGLRIHDGNESGGNPIGITSYQSLNDLPTNLASIQSGNVTNNRQFLRYNSSTYEMEFANDFRVVPFADIDYPTGVYGDKIGDVAFDADGIYYCGSEPNFIGNVTITSGGGYSNQAWVVITSIPNNTPVHIGERLTDGTITQTVEEIVEGWPGYDGSRMIVRVAADVPGWHGGTPSTLSVISSGESVSTGNWAKFSKFNQSLNTSDSVSFDSLNITAAAGAEGGEIHLARAPQSTLSGDIGIDIYGNKLRFFENGGNYRGFYLDLSTGADGIDTNIISGGSSFSGSYNDLTDKPTIPADVNQLADSSSLLPAAQVRYEMRSANFTAVAGKTYWLDSGTTAKTVTLPASPTVGDWVRIYDASNNWQTYNLTVNGNGNNVRTFNLPQGWNSPASTGTINQSLISPAGPFALALIWDGTSWFSAI